MQIKNAEFLFGSPTLKELPIEGLPEVAIAGRSNAGKSTLINRLTGRKQLAKTGAAPGRTREFNFFKITTDRNALLLVDLPGFGYAKFSKEKRADLNRSIVEYITSRSELKLVCLLNDARRLPAEDEFALRDLTFQSGKHLLVIITKLDTLNQSEKHRNIPRIAERYGLEPEDLVLTGKKGGVEMVWERVVSVL